MMALVLLSACGGSGSGGGQGILTPGVDEDDLYYWQEDVFYSSDYYKDKCEIPRTGEDIFNNNRPFPDEEGEVVDENFWIRSWINELYLWYDEVEDRNPRNYQDPIEYFNLLKTTQLTPTGQAKDNFHFTADTFEYRSSAVSGVSFGFGIQFAYRQLSPPREIIVADVIPGSSADLAGVQRGMLVTAIDGADMIDGDDVDTLNAGLFPSVEGEAHVYSFQAAGELSSTDFEIVTGSYEDEPVKYVTTIDTESGLVGYIHFKTHNYPSEGSLYTAFTQLANSGVSDLVLDLRYNGGGLLDVAAEVGYMIAGSVATNNRTFFMHTFNDKHENINPVTQQAIQAIPFHDQTRGFSELGAGVQLPELNLSRVYIIATGGTCSASEAIINGLRGIGVEVVLIGETTCGKPYGFYAVDNCGTTYFSIQFTGVNDLGFGEYSNGFSSTDELNFIGIELPGCYVQDDLSKALGDAEEGMLATALYYRAEGSCPSAQAQVKPVVERKEKAGDGKSLTIPQDKLWLNNMMLTQ